MTTEIKSFSQALPILAAHGIEPTPAGNRQWNVGPMTYDKGGIVALARELIARGEAAVPVAPAALSLKMQHIARDYVAAREKAGESLLAAARYLAEARAAAKHGEWGLFLEATNTSEGTAKRWLDIHEAAERDAKFADGLRSGRLAFTVAAELAQPSTPPALIEAALAAESAPTVAEVRAAKSAIVADLKPNIPELPTDDHVTQMRERFYALGYEQFYASDAGWTAYHPRTKKANYKTWADVEADIARKEGMASMRCETCGGHWGAPGSMVTSEGRLCQNCAAARLSSGQPFGPAADAPVTRRCGRCKEPTRDLTGYGPGIVPEYPDGITLCPRCVTALLRERSTTNGTTALTIARCEDCGGVATNKQNIGGTLAHRCDTCAAQARYDAAQEQAQIAPSDGPLAALVALCDRAEALGAMIDYTALRDPARVRVTPPPGYQQHPLDCDIGDLTRLVEAWEQQAAWPAPSPIDTRASLYRHWRAAEEALDRADQKTAEQAILAMFRAVRGPCSIMVFKSATIDRDALADNIRAIAAGVHPERVEPGLGVLRAVFEALAPESEATA